MAAIDYLRARDLQAEYRPGGRLYVWPSDNITPEVRDWIKAHRDELLEELAAANDPETVTEITVTKAEYRDAPTPRQEPPAPQMEIDLLLRELRFDFTGARLHTIDDELAGAIRQAMQPMGRRARAELAAWIDDELATDGRKRVLALLQRRIEAQPPAAWLEWIEQECPLVAGDTELVGRELARLATKEQEQVARRYVATWQEAADAEPQAHRKANAGRRAANQSLLPTKSQPMATDAQKSAPRQPIPASAPPRLPEGVRMAWTIRVGSKRLVLAGTAYTREQAQQAAQARWPDTDIEVTDD